MIRRIGSGRISIFSLNRDLNATVHSNGALTTSIRGSQSGSDVTSQMPELRRVVFERNNPQSAGWWTGLSELSDSVWRALGNGLMDIDPHQSTRLDDPLITERFRSRSWGGFRFDLGFCGNFCRICCVIEKVLCMSSEIVYRTDVGYERF